MIRSVLFIAILALLASCKYSKLVIHASNGKFKIKENTSIAVTMKGEAYPFEEACNSTCKSCDPKLAAARWLIDSLRTNEIVLRYEHTFRYDTISHGEYKSRSGKAQRTNLERVINIDRRPWYVYKIPVDVERKTYSYDQLGTITYSYRPECYRGSPIKGIFANPNRVRKVEMEGAEINVVFH